MTEEVSARDELYEIAALLREADEQEKKGKLQKESYRGPFFELISEIVREEIPLARQTVEVAVIDGFDIDAWRAHNYPEWRICGLNQKVPETLIVTLEEHEAFKKFEFVHDGFKYGRQIRMEGKGFDVENFVTSLNDEEVDMSDEAREALRTVATEKTIVVYEVDETQMAKVMADYPETVALFQKYMLPGTPKPALLPIRAAKEEEE